jgi:kanamycin kinase/aminoglycoside 3'-phosphotransferase-3
MDNLLYSLPGKIRNLVEGKSYTTDDIGKSGSMVLIFEDMVLKITDKPSDDKDAVEMMRWLEGKIPAPQVIAFEEDDSRCYLLMSRVRGKMACDRYYLERPKELVPLLSKSVKMIQSIDVKDCPVVKDLDRSLKEAEYRVENGLVDISDAEPGTFGENGRFRDPVELLSWLKENRPSYEPVLSHGDLCLPNILIEDGDISGFIDMGNCGIADKWEDIAMLYRSLRHNFDGTYGKVYPGLDPDSFFAELGIVPDYKKIDYYILLDELF